MKFLVKWTLNDGAVREAVAYTLVDAIKRATEIFNTTGIAPHIERVMVSK